MPFFRGTRSPVLIGKDTRGYSDPVVSKVINIGAGEADGFVTNGNKGVSPTDYIHVWYDFDAGHVIADKYVASAKTTLIDEAEAYVADKKLIGVCWFNSSRTELYLDVFYNGAKIGTTQTISDAAILGGSYHYASGDGSGAFAVRRWSKNIELVSNSEITTDTSGWSDANYVLSRVDSAIDPGASSGGTDNYCLKCVADGASNRSAKINIPVESGKLYYTSIRYYIPTGDPSLFIAFGSQPNIQDLNVVSGSNLAKDAWTKIDCMIVSSQDGGIPFNFGNYSGGGAVGDVLYADSISVREVLLP